MNKDTQNTISNNMKNIIEINNVIVKYLEDNNLIHTAHNCVYIYSDTLKYLTKNFNFNKNIEKMFNKDYLFIYEKSKACLIYKDNIQYYVKRTLMKVKKNNNNYQHPHTGKLAFKWNIHIDYKINEDFNHEIYDYFIENITPNITKI